MTGRARTVLTGLAALAVLAALLVGLPLVLYRFGGAPLPSRMPGWHALLRQLASRDNGGTALAVIRDCAWLAWLLFAACVLAEAQAAVRGRRAPRLRLGGIQGAAAQLVALAALTFSAPTSIASAAAGMPVATLDSMATPDSAATSLTVTVHAGDCLWSIAQRYLGAGDRYPEIAALNYGRPMGDGEVLNIRRRCTCCLESTRRAATRSVEHCPCQGCTRRASAVLLCRTLSRCRRPRSTTGSTGSARCITGALNRHCVVSSPNRYCLASLAGGHGAPTGRRAGGRRTPVFPTASCK
jgi:hypothetical protein